MIWSYFKYILVVISQLFSIKSMKNKNYIGFFYGCYPELIKSFTEITNGGNVRYILTAETIICRYQSIKVLNEMSEIIRKNCPDIPFFIFPISNKHWTYNLPLDVENNLLTDNPIIQTPQTQAINDYFMSMINSLQSKQLNSNNDQSLNFIDLTTSQLTDCLNRAVSEDNFELAIKIRDKIKELSKNNLIK